MGNKEEIIQRIEHLSGSYSPYEIFSDWVKMTAISIANSFRIDTQTWEKREAEYMETAKKYSADDLKQICGMTGLLAMELEENRSDVLGDIYMKAGLGNKGTGQFFTPYHISELLARMSFNPDKDTGRITINEPSCGGGGMIIATAEEAKRRGINQSKLEIVAQDLDWRSVYMCYVQLSLLGLRGIVVQGDSLKNRSIREVRKECVFLTPAKMMF